MNTNIISDRYGNMKKVSGRTDNISMILDMTENRKKISDKPDTASSIICISTNKNRANQKSKLTHGTCTKGSCYCKEQEDGSLWMYVDTYKTRVTFCPYCGYRTKG